jgi:hypothetical protein
MRVQIHEDGRPRDFFAPKAYVGDFVLAVMPRIFAVNLFEGKVLSFNVRPLGLLIKLSSRG